MLPILYSFRRCPYAMRARLAIAVANTQVELREVVLKQKPAALVTASKKATVPVLVNGDAVLDESLDIMHWALQQNDPNNWLCVGVERLTDHPLIAVNDFKFKPLLDKYKYFDRHPELPQSAYLEQSLFYFEQLEDALVRFNGFLAASHFTAIDAAILPFVRQFAFCDQAQFQTLGFDRLWMWLQQGLESALFTSIMSKYPQWRPNLENSEVFPS